MRPALRFAFALLIGFVLVHSAARAQSIPAPKLGGYLQVKEVAHKDVGLTATLNRARVSIDGSLPAYFSYRFLVEMEAPATGTAQATVSLREAIARWALGGAAFQAGQFKVPFSREYLIPIPQLETPDFAAVVDSLAPKYDIGMMGEFAFGPYGQVYAGVFNGEGQNASANRDSIVMLVGRGVVRPLPQVTLGGNLTRDSKDSLRWGVETQLEQSGAFVRAEYITRHRRGRETRLDDRGWYVLGIDRVIPRLQVLAREEGFERPWIGVARRVRATTIGTIIEIAPSRVRLLVDGVRRTSGAKQTRTDTLIAQLQVRF
jgi:hypothetical protein